MSDTSITPDEIIAPQKPTAKQPKTTRKINPQHATYALLRQEGLTPGKAAQAVGLTRQHGYNLEKKLTIYDEKKDSLLKSSVRNLQKIVNGQGFGTIDKIKDSTALAGIVAVLDREVPKVNLSQSLNVNVNLDHCPIDLSELE